LATLAIHMPRNCRFGVAGSVTQAVWAATGTVPGDVVGEGGAAVGRAAPSVSAATSASPGRDR